LSALSRASLLQPVAAVNVCEAYREKENRGTDKRNIEHFVLTS